MAASRNLERDATVRYMDPGFTNAYAQEWSASYERRFGELWTSGVTYTQVLGLH